MTKPTFYLDVVVEEYLFHFPVLRLKLDYLAFLKTIRSCAWRSCTMASNLKHSDFFAFELGLRLAKIEPDAGLRRRVELLKAVAAGLLTLSEPADIVATQTSVEDATVVQKNLQARRAKDKKVAKIILEQVEELF